MWLLNIFFMSIILMIPVASAIRTSMLSFSEEKGNKVIERLLTTSFADRFVTAGRILVSFIVSLLAWATIVLYIGVRVLLEIIFIGGTFLTGVSGQAQFFLLVASIVILPILVVIGFFLYIRTARAVSFLSSLVAPPIIVLFITQSLGFWDSGTLGLSPLFLLICGLITFVIDIVGLFSVEM